MSIIKNAGKAGSLAILSMACSTFPKDASPLTEEERAIIEAEMIKYDRVEPVLEAVWGRSSIDFNLERETVTPAESIESLSIAATHFRWILDDGRVMAQDSIGGVETLAKMRGRNKSDNKDYIVLDRSSMGSWKYSTFLHEAIHSFADDSSAHSENLVVEGSTADSIARTGMQERDSATVVGDFCLAFHWEAESPLFGSVLLVDVDGEARLDWWLRKTPDEYAHAILGDGPETSEMAQRFEPFGVTYEELYEVYSNPEMVEYLKSQQIIYEREWREAEAEASSERRRSEGGRARR